MSEHIEPETASRDALGVAIRTLIAQAFALDRMFFRAAKESALDDMSNRHMRKALKAQDRCRATFKILIALGAVKRQPEKFSNLTEGTIQTLKMPGLPIPYEGAKRPAPPLRTDSTYKRLGAGKRWTPERRARQAEAIRSWQPWRKSSGPKTTEGKARSARNALKHGNKSRAYVEMLREDRRLLHVAAANIAIAKACLRGIPASPITLNSTSPSWGGRSRRSGVAAKADRACLAGLSAEAQRAKAEAAKQRRQVGGLCARQRAVPSHRIGIGRARPTLIPFPRKFSGNRGHSGLLPGDNAAPRRRWRLARHDEEDVPLKQG